MPDLSVIVVAHGQDNALTHCLSALARQRGSAGDREVVLVLSGGARASTVPLVAPGEAPRVVVTHDGGRWSARNAGLAAASGCFCLFLEATTIPGENVAADHLRRQREQGGRVVVGPVWEMVGHQTDRYARGAAETYNAETRCLIEGEAPRWLPEHLHDNLSVPRAALLAVGGFPDDLEELAAVEVAARLRAAGLPLVVAPAAAAMRWTRRSFAALTAAAERAGRDSVRLMRRQPDLLEHLPIGHFNDASIREVLLRKALLRLGVPVAPLAALDRLVDRGAWGFQWRRFVHVLHYWRGVRQAVPDEDTWQRLTHGTVILMYHAIGAPGEPASRYILPVSRLQRHLAWLKWRNYRVIGLDEYVTCRQRGELPPARSIILTFDDGYADNGRLLASLLRRFGFPATVFLVSHRMDRHNDWDDEGELVGRPILTWSELDCWRRDGLDFQAHTRRHAKLTRVPVERAREEIAGSREDLERAMGRPVRHFAYPHGMFDATTERLTVEAGFASACSCISGVNDPHVPLSQLRRAEISGTETFFEFLQAIWFGIPHALTRRWAE